jgi:hypothetical protein
LNEFNGDRAGVAVEDGQGVVLDIKRHRKREKGGLENDGKEKQDSTLRIAEKGLQLLDNEGTDAFEHGRINRDASE